MTAHLNKHSEEEKMDSLPLEAFPDDILEPNRS